MTALSPSWAVCKAVNSIFSWPKTSNTVGTWFITSLLATPDYRQKGTNLAQVGENSSAVAFGILAATISFAVIQYWLSGVVSMGGGFAGAEGIARGVGAALFIALWPWIFHEAVAFSNALSAAVVQGGVQARISKLFLAALFFPATSGVALIVAILLAIPGLILMLGLLVLKMAMGAVLAVIFVGMPILIALGVVPTLAWLPRLAIKGMTMILLIPWVWALIFAVFTGLALDSVTFGNLHSSDAGFWGTLLRPLVSITLLFLMVELPRKLSSLASLSAVIPGGSAVGGGAGRGGQMLERAGGTVLGRAGANAATEFIPPELGGRHGLREQQQEERETREGHWRRQEEHWDRQEEQWDARGGRGSKPAPAPPQPPGSGGAAHGGQNGEDVSDAELMDEWVPRQDGANAKLEDVWDADVSDEWVSGQGGGSQTPESGASSSPQAGGTSRPAIGSGADAQGNGSGAANGTGPTGSGSTTPFEPTAGPSADDPVIDAYGVPSGETGAPAEERSDDGGEEPETPPAPPAATGDGSATAPPADPIAT